MIQFTEPSLGYEDFLSYYDKIEQIRRGWIMDSRLFISCVSKCFQYMQSLTPYECQCVIAAIPGIDDKMASIKDLYVKIRNAVNESVDEVTGR